MPLSDASTTRAPWSAAHAKAAAMSHARPLPDASRARSGTMPAFGAPQVTSPLPWVPSLSARRAAHARSREAKREPDVLRKRRLDFVPSSHVVTDDDGYRSRRGSRRHVPAFGEYRVCQLVVAETCFHARAKARAVRQWRELSRARTGPDSAAGSVDRSTPARAKAITRSTNRRRLAAVGDGPRA